ncbi:glycosyl transferase family 25 [Psychrobacter sp. PL15]|uniref:glycosyltransferase family 25 protein n=1 Tax=Psychrobacter sp. PL15 TaxID=3071719 RepID=UPI002E0135FB|nr:glycosyl transferase family 25 [Psychrobacter sp. PL15]
MKVITYLINLDGSDERLNSATQQLDQIDWPFERFAAYDGRGMALSDFNNYNDWQTKENLGRSLLNSEIGCYLSHYNCVQQFLKTDADFLIVLEDDMKISSDFKTLVDELLKFLYIHHDIDWYLINIAAKKKKMAKNITTINNHTLWHAYYFPVLGLGLIWSRKGAEEFVEKGKDITMPVDVFFQRWLSGNGKGLGIWPALVTATGSESDIWNSGANPDVSRKDKEDRVLSYSLKKKKRMWQDKISAAKHLYLDK